MVLTIDAHLWYFDEIELTVEKRSPILTKGTDRTERRRATQGEAIAKIQTSDLLHTGNQWERWNYTKKNLFNVESDKHDLEIVW